MLLGQKLVQGIAAGIGLASESIWRTKQASKRKRRPIESPDYPKLQKREKHKQNPTRSSD